ncbi:MAG: hypothetical protein Edafosvirus17_25 [Edafosvirus sp.]|uniref:Uncharacterized protein n=1 Tax=Edafosvirus sp. TaxID=2487765 RepID=A0A3G4ZYR3_9VIRU|nr:MAG: hypothetical protein Edafosvirus17_25 [Edafosvirus sp.]
MSKPKPKLNDDNERLREIEEEGTELKTTTYLIKNQWIAVILFIMAIIMATIWFYTIHKGLCLSLNVNDLNFMQWLIFAIASTVFLWIITYHIIKVPVTAAFGY